MSVFSKVAVSVGEGVDLLVTDGGGVVVRDNARFGAAMRAGAGTGVLSLSALAASMEPEICAAHLAIETLVAGVYTRATDGKGEPLTKIVEARGLAPGFDLWFVDGGYLTQTSVLGKDLSNFQYDAVFCPDYISILRHSGSQVATHVRPVVTRVRMCTDPFGGNIGVTGMSRDGEVRAKYIGVDYTGLVMVSDGMTKGAKHDIQATLHGLYEFRSGVEMEFVDEYRKSYTPGLFKGLSPGFIIVVNDEHVAEVCRQELLSLKAIDGTNLANVVKSLEFFMSVESGLAGGGTVEVPCMMSLHFYGWRGMDFAGVYRTIAMLTPSRVVMHDYSPWKEIRQGGLK